MTRRRGPRSRPLATPCHRLRARVAQALTAVVGPRPQAKVEAEVEAEVEEEEAAEAAEC